MQVLTLTIIASTPAVEVARMLSHEQCMMFSVTCVHHFSNLKRKMKINACMILQSHSFHAFSCQYISVKLYSHMHIDIVYNWLGKVFYYLIL